MLFVLFGYVVFGLRPWWSESFQPVVLEPVPNTSSEGEEVGLTAFFKKR
jgi:hypothetical protein